MIFNLRLTILSLITACSATTANAAACGPRDQVVSRLSATYGETVQSMGLGSNNGIVEVYASAETGTWTITVTMANGQMCLIASGQSFEPMIAPVQAAGEDV